MIARAPHHTLLGRLRRAGPLRRLTALAGMLAVLLQVAVPIAHSAWSAQLDSVAAELAAFDAAARNTLCTAHSDEADRTAPSPDDAHHGLPACPMCQAVLHAGLLLPPDAAALPAPPPAAAVDGMAPSAPLRAVETTHGAQPRAPPERF